MTPLFNPFIHCAVLNGVEHPASHSPRVLAGHLGARAGGLTVQELTALSLIVALAFGLLRWFRADFNRRKGGNK